MPTLEERLAKAKKSTLEERLARAQSVKGEGAATAFVKSAGRTVVDNLFGLPSLAGEALAAGGTLLESPLELPGQPSLTFGERFQRQRESFPAKNLREFRPTVEGLVADVRSLPKLFPGGESFGESRKRLREEFAAQSAQRQEQFPKATKGGEITGDVATILSGRAPAARGLNQLETKLFGRADDIFFGGAVPKIADPGVKRFVNRVVNSKRVRAMARGAGRSVEAGFEAAALDILKGDAPLETAAYAAGVQVGGSLSLTAAGGLVSGGPLRAGVKVGVAALSFGALLQLLKETVPGGQDNLLSSVEVGFEKVQFAIVMGMIGAAGGAGRGRGTQLAEDFPKLIDAMAAVPRVAIISMLEDWRNADPQTQETIELVAGKLVEEPDYFGKTITERLQGAMENNRFVDELRAQLNNDKFVEKLFLIKNPDLAGPDKKFNRAMTKAMELLPEAGSTTFPDGTSVTIQ